VRFALVGCGDIARRYADRIAAHRLDFAGATDLLPERAREIVAAFGGTAYGSLAELLADDRVEAVVNLTAPPAHAEVTAAALEAGKHVHTEKPLALTHADAVALVQLAASRGLALSCAPATLLGEAQQTAWKLLREGAIGRVRAAYAEANWGRIERWHPSPASLYSVGPMVDVGVYPLTILTGMFGAARRVSAFATVLEADRIRRDGSSFLLERPDFVVAIVELPEIVARVTASFYVEHRSYQRGIEFHGDDGSLHLRTWAEFDARVELARDGTYESVLPVRDPYPGIDWGRALVELAEGRARPPDHAAHVVEVLEAIATSAGGGRPVDVGSRFEPVQPMAWAL
jgi:predicted dehydrogenase